VARRGDCAPGGGFVVNDAYNANPDSMRAALVAPRGARRRPRRVAILGEMAELGEQSAAYHGEIGQLAADLGIDVIGVGESARMYTPTVWIDSAPAVAEVAREYLRPG
jgi:UDP-N-acetylmuramoyl-tripeptide--D-alanyl-D-alanine ligase